MIADHIEIQFQLFYSSTSIKSGSKQVGGTIGKYIYYPLNTHLCVSFKCHLPTLFILERQCH